MSYIDRFHKSWTSLFFVGCLSLFLGLATSQSVRAEIDRVTANFDIDGLDWDNNEEHPYRLPLVNQDYPAGPYSYLGLEWTNVGVVIPGTYYDTFQEKSGFSMMIHRNGTATNVAYNDSALPITISMPEGETGAFQFLGGFFQPMKFFAGAIRVTGTVFGSGDIISRDYDIGNPNGDYAIDLDSVWGEEWLTELKIESLLSGFVEDNEEDWIYGYGTRAYHHFVFDNLVFDIDPDFDDGSGVFSATPEPASLLLFACGGLGLLAYRRRKV